MSGNDLVLLKELVAQKRGELAPEIPESDFFEIFVAEQAMKDRDLSYEEIEQGVVGGGGDGGIDAVYFFANNCLIREPGDIGEVKREVPVELVFIQATTSSGFAEDKITKLHTSAKDLLDLDKNIDTLKTVYNAELLEKMTCFRETYKALVSKIPKLSIRYFYAALAIEVHQNVTRQVEPLRQAVQSLFKPINFSFDFLTADKLYAMAQRLPVTTHGLQLAEQPIATQDQGYICLVSLRDYFNFVKNDDGTLNERIFESNVRDYQGATEVNEKIRKTLEHRGPENFWWLNNGITIVCGDAKLSGKTLVIVNPEVVNGLQTSREIHNVLSARHGEDDKREVLVRVLVAPAEESRDQIIRATNSQTSIPTASLRATDTIHRKIEAFLAARGLFYDRRKNYYKNQGKPLKDIIGIPSLAQLILACVLLDPANARARPSSVIKRDTDYARIFDEAYPLVVYNVCAMLGRKVDDALRSKKCTVERSHWNNIKYYVVMLATLRLSGTAEPSPEMIASIDLNSANEPFILGCVNDVWKHYKELGGTDQVAKGTDLTTKLIEGHQQFCKDLGMQKK